MSTESVSQQAKRTIEDTRTLVWFLLFVGSASLVVPVFVIESAFTVVYPVALLISALVLLLIYYSGGVSADARLLSGNLVSYDEYRTRRAVLGLYLLTLSAAIFLYSSHGFRRSLSVHIALGALFVISILSIPATKNDYLPLFLVVMTGIINRGLIYFSSPFAYGRTDQHWHYGKAQAIAVTGDLMPLYESKHYFAPFYHIYGAFSSLLLDLDIRSGVMFLTYIVAFTILAALVIFWVLRHQWSAEVGTGGAFLYLVSDHATGQIVTMGTTQAGLIFMIVSVFIAFRYTQTRSVRHLALLIGMVVSLTLLHQPSTFVTIFTLSMFLLSGLAYSNRTRYSAYPVVIFVFIGLTDWIISRFGMAGETLFEWFVLNLLGFVTRFVGFVTNPTGEAGGGSVSFPSNAGVVPVSPLSSFTVLHVAGGGILFGLAVIGSVVWLTTRTDSDATSAGFSISVVASAFLLLVGIGPLVGFDGLSPTRYFMHLYFFLCLLAAPGLYCLATRADQAVRGNAPALIAVLVVFLSIYIALMGGNLFGSIDDPVYDDAPAAERMSFTEEEAEQMYFVTSHTDPSTVIASDGEYMDILRFYGRGDTRTAIRGTYTSGEIEYTDQEEDLIIIRENAYSGHVQFNLEVEDSVFRVYGVPPINSMGLDTKNKIYQSESCEELDSRCGVYAPL